MKNRKLSALLNTPPRGAAMASQIAVIGRILASLSLLGLLALAPPVAQAAERLTLCYDKAQAQLVPLAQLRDFYTAEELDVELRAFPSGRQALEAMFAGECALSTVAETPTVYYSLQRNDFYILASIAQSDNFERIIVRSDRGILTPADLRGRRIAVPKFTTGHYFLDMYLVTHGLSPQDVKQIFMPPQEMAAAFRRGEVDAVAQWEPFIQKLAEEFGAKAQVFSVPGLHVSPFLLVGGRDTVRKNPVVIERVLRALVRAERYNKEQPANAKALVTHFYNTEEREINLIWSLKEQRISLDQSLLFILENAARWEIGLMPPAQRPALPNYLDFIYLDGLKAVKPEVVTIIH
jgi:NitT/TauT family transport system substrate-binding protein